MIKEGKYHRSSVGLMGPVYSSLAILTVFANLFLVFDFFRFEPYFCSNTDPKFFMFASSSLSIDISWSFSMYGVYYSRDPDRYISISDPIASSITSLPDEFLWMLTKVTSACPADM